MNTQPDLVSLRPVAFFVTVCIAITLGSPIARAGLTAQDTFDYAAGALNAKNGGTGWNGAWSSPSGATISTTSITYNFGGTVLGGGNSLKITNGANPLQRDVFAAPDTSGQDYYVSFIFQNTGTTFVGVQAKDNNVSVTNDTIGLINNGAVGARVGNTTSTASTSFADGITHFFVIQYTGWDGSTYRTANIWLNPTTGGEGANSISATYTGTVNQGSSGFVGLYIRTVISATDGTQWMYVDDLRVGTDWASVTAIPEPGFSAIIAGFTVCLLAIVKRRDR
ncbi:MAG TPA: hypothetical protein VIO38_14900 [Rariglobus sp.]